MDKFIEKITNADERELARLQVEDDTEQMNEHEKRQYCINVLQKGHIGWNHKTFARMLAKEKEIDSYKQTKPEVEEGVLQCKRCNSKRVLSYQTQARSADEPMTTVAKCSECNTSWTENN